MEKEFIYNDYFGTITYDTRTNFYCKSNKVLFDIYTLIPDDEPFYNLRCNHKVYNLIHLFNMPFLNESGVYLFPINFSSKDVKNYIKQLDEKQSEIILKASFMVLEQIKDRSNKNMLLETKILDTIRMIIKKRYPVMYKKLLMEIRLGRKRH